jgi:hypothetical protein
MPPPDFICRFRYASFAAAISYFSPTLKLPTDALIAAAPFSLLRFHDARVPIGRAVLPCEGCLPRTAANIDTSSSSSAEILHQASLSSPAAAHVFRLPAVITTAPA